MATLNDVAQFCGTSPSTISKVLNGYGGKISAAKREEILAAVKQLQYQPAAHARSLARKKASMIGVVTTRMPRFLTYQYIVLLLSAILDEANNHKQTVALFNGQVWTDESQQQLALADGRCDGFVVIDANSIPGLIPALLKASIPFVAVNSDPQPETVTTVDIDNIQAGYTATNHLIERGHRYIAYLENEPQSFFSRMRLQGYKKALEEAGIEFDEQLVISGDGVARHAYDRAQSLAASQPLVTALFCAHDAIALSAIQGLKDAGFRVPDDYSVIGINDIPDAETSVPSLTTMSQDLDGLGIRATQVLLDLIENPEQPPRQILWPIQLVERESVSVPRSKTSLLQDTKIQDTQNQ